MLPLIAQTGRKALSAEHEVLFLGRQHHMLELFRVDGHRC